MMFAMPQYEVKYFNTAEWEEISEADLMQRLLESYDKIAPVVQQMIDGKQVLTQDAVYRLKEPENFQFLL